MQCFLGVDYGNNVRKVLTEHSREWAGIPYLHKLSTFFLGGGSHWEYWVYVYNESSSIVYGTKYRHQIAQRSLLFTFIVGKTKTLGPLMNKSSHF